MRFPFVHVVLSHFIVMFCTISFFEDEQFARTGKMYSPITLILIAGEILRWGISKYAFGLDASIKEYSMSGTRPASTKSLSVLVHVKKICKLGALLTTSVLMFVIVCILLGASYHQNYEETIALSLLLTSITILPIALFLGPSKTIQYLFYDSFELNFASNVWQLELLKNNALGTLVGAWAGSIVAPLDWDRSWQAYPIPNMVGAVLGFSFANIHTFLTSIVQVSDQVIDVSIISNDKKTS